MNILSNIIIGLIILLAFCGAVAYIIRAKRKGVKCIGCPAAGQCQSARTAGKQDAGGGSCCGCSHSQDEGAVMAAMPDNRH